MLKYDNGLELDVTIGGVQLPDNEFSFHHLSLISDTRFFLPMMFLQFADQGDILRKAGVTLFDAVPIIISLGTGDQKINYEFRLHRPEQVTSGNLTIYKMSAYLDAPLYLAESMNKGYLGTSSEVITQIGERSGLTVEAEPTTDNQRWWQGNRRNADFVRYLAQHGYKSDESLMVTGVRFDKALRYMDINGIEPRDMWLSYTKMDSNVVTLVDHRFNDPMGGNNLIRGYRSRTIDQKVDSPDTNYNDSSVNPRASTVSMNTDLQSQLQRGKVEFSPLYGPDTVHDNWAKARHQNLRGRYLNNTTCAALTTNQSNLDLFDSVKLDSSLSVRDNSMDDGQNSSREGQYIVAGKEIMLVGRNYGERIKLIRAGMNGGDATK